MPGNPIECRRHAANCRRLSQEAASPAAREHFDHLAEQWEGLAAELEAAQIFLLTMNEITPPEIPNR
jgi:hypothetical protein